MTGNQRDEILRVIRQVRRRWRTRVALGGTGIVLATGFAVFFLSSVGLEAFKFSATAIVVFRVLTYLAVLGLAGWFLVRPLARRVSDEQVALYLEEHEPSLQAAILSAVEESKKGDRSNRPDYSPALVNRLLESAIEECRRINFGRAVEERDLRRAGGLLAACAVVTLLAFVFGPAYLRYGALALLFPTGSAEAVSPYRIDVAPGSTRVARGSDQTITARLHGFHSDEVNLFVRTSSGAPFERLPLVPAEDGEGFEVILFDVEEKTDYFVEAVGVQSSRYTLDVVDLPYVERLELEYHFPAYTGLEPRLVEDGGDIAVLRGTEVRLRAYPTMTTPAGKIRFDDTRDMPLAGGAPASEPAEGTHAPLTGSFVVEEDGFYRIELQGPDGEFVTASPQYTIDVLTDQPPSVVFRTPGRDTTASAIEEVFVEARADDDFGIRSLDLVYSVNGGPEQVVSLFDGRTGALKEVAAGHTFFLEELELQPGDFLSYFARAADRNLAQQKKTVSSDLYFVQIRAFRKDFRAADSQAGLAGAGGGGMDDPRALSDSQREIISATFNVVRDRATLSDGQYRENVVFLALAQGRLREQVETLVRRMNSRVMPADPAFRKIAEILPIAAEEMKAAEDKLQAQDAAGALGPEQRALQHLQRAEEAYQEVLVTMGGGGGGGGGSAQAAEDLADLFELELDKLRNQYETLQRGEQQMTDNQIDELMERLRELARRQEREAERQRRLARGSQSPQAGGGGANQRALAEETEEAARRLERLAREMASPDMMAAARRLQEAADAMRRAAANADNMGVGEAGAALDRLKEVQDRLRNEQSGRLERNIRDAMRRADRLADEQRQVASGVEGLTGLDDGARLEQLRRLMERKDAMEAEVADLERQLDSTAAEFARDERDASRKVQEAANTIRDNKLKEKIRYTKGVIRARSPEMARAFEEEIGGDIGELRERLGEAAGLVGKSQGDKMTEALERTRDLMRGIESLEQRMAEAGQPGSNESGPQDGQQSGEPRGQQSGQQAGQPGGQPGQQAGGQVTDAPGDPNALGDTVGGPGVYGGSAQRRPGTGVFDPQDIRQWQREYRQRATDAQELQRLLRQEQFEAGDLDEIIRAMRELDSSRVYRDAEELLRLQTFVLEGLKRFEYRLRRELNADREDLLLSASEDVPSGFRELVEEYYRVLSREK